MSHLNPLIEIGFGRGSIPFYLQAYFCLKLSQRASDHKRAGIVDANDPLPKTRVPHSSRIL